MAHYKFMLLEYNAGKDGKTAVTLRITTYSGAYPFTFRQPIKHKNSL